MLLLNNSSLKKLTKFFNLDKSSVIIIIIFPFKCSLMQNFINSETLLLSSVRIYLGINKGFVSKSKTFFKLDLTVLIS